VHYLTVINLIKFSETLVLFGSWTQCLIDVYI